MFSFPLWAAGLEHSNRPHQVLSCLCEISFVFIYIFSHFVSAFKKRWRPTKCTSSTKALCIRSPVTWTTLEDVFSKRNNNRPDLLRRFKWSLCRVTRQVSSGDWVNNASPLSVTKREGCKKNKNLRQLRCSVLGACVVNTGDCQSCFPSPVNSHCWFLFTAKASFL